MNIILNGTHTEFHGNSLADLLESLQPKQPFAAAVNAQFVSKQVYTQTLLAENDAIDIVSPVVGG